MAIVELIGGPGDGMKIDMPDCRELRIPVIDPHLAIRPSDGSVYELVCRSHSYLRQDDGRYAWNGPSCKNSLHDKTDRSDPFPFRLRAENDPDKCVYTKCPGCSEMVRHLPEAMPIKPELPSPQALANAAGDEMAKRLDRCFLDGPESMPIEIKGPAGKPSGGNRRELL